MSRPTKRDGRIFLVARLDDCRVLDINSPATAREFFVWKKKDPAEGMAGSCTTNLRNTGGFTGSGERSASIKRQGRSRVPAQFAFYL